MHKNGFLWIDWIKAFALLWIVLNHVVERIFGYPLIANPAAGWPALSERIAQLAPLSGYGIWSLAVNLTRYAGWLGDQGVQLFLIVSGFGLTWGLLARGQAPQLPLWTFWQRRAQRIYPLWWGAHLVFIGTWLVVGWGLALTAPELYLSLLGIRFTPNTIYYFAPAWWYIGLLIQLYLLYPLLWVLLRQWGAGRFLLVACLVGFIARAVGALLFEGYLDAWLRGAIFVTRLPEFAFGMSLAAWWTERPAETQALLRRPLTLLAALLVYMLGILLSLTLLGMAVAPFMTGAAAFVLLYALFSRWEDSRSATSKAGTWIGEHSYSLYLMHHPFILALVPFGAAAAAGRTIGGVLIAAALTVVAALLLEAAVGRSLTVVDSWRAKAGVMGTLLRAALIGAAAVFALIAAELAVRRLNPQEVLGWGERPSLEPNAEYGWRLRPAQTTRLRWESYDYTVTANSLGFPGPEPMVSPPSETFRIMTVGDAFTSAEGVDTEAAWPRLLETKMKAGNPEQDVEVINFGVTGYGPNQYAAVVRRFAPELRPNLIVVGFFVNDYQDVLWSNEGFQDSIGFGLQSQNSLFSILRLSHLQKLVQLTVKEPLIELLRGEPRSHGYFLGNFQAFDRENPLAAGDGREQVRRRLVEIREVADGLGAGLVILMIPASVQVCDPAELDYYPRHVELGDRSRYDLDQPQKVTKELASALRIPTYDLRPTLQAVDGRCPYQAKNMHWTEAGHQAVAAFLAGEFTSPDSLVRR